MASVRVFAKISQKVDPSGNGNRYVFGTSTADVWIANNREGERYCSHTHDYDTLEKYLQTNAGAKDICPTCAEGSPTSTAFWTKPTMSIWALLNATASLSKLRDLVMVAGLANALNNDGDYTVFAPSNEAIGMLSKAPTGEDLVTLLLHHVVPSRITAADIKFGVTEVETLAKTKLYVRREGPTIFVDSVKEGKGEYAGVCATDIVATNGYAHVIDRVLIPPSLASMLSAPASVQEMPLFLEYGLGENALPWTGTIAGAIAWTPRLFTLTQMLRSTGLLEMLDDRSGPQYTLFAPTNEAFAALPSTDFDAATLRMILSHHVLEGTVLSSAIPRGRSVQKKTLAGTTIELRLSDNGMDVLVDSVVVVAADFTVTNGVIHAIDKVLIPRSLAMNRSVGTSAGMQLARHTTATTKPASFRAFNMKPSPFASHRSESATEHVELSQYEDRFPWTSTVGQGYVLPYNMQKVAYGESIDDLMSEARQTSDFEIAHTVMLPKAWDRPTVPGSNDDKTVVLMIHGVPGNRKWKYHMMEILARRGCIVVACDLLGMGESSQVLDYRRFDQGSDDGDINSAWDWTHDVAWLSAFIRDGVLKSDRLGFRTKNKVVVAADDWGAGPAEWLLATPGASNLVQHLMLVNPIHLDGYFVIEIGTIGRIDELRRKAGNAAFQQATETLPQVMLGIEKYMIQDRKRMNRYTESSFLFPYQDTDYQAGNTAADMKPNYWNMAVLAARASRLAPRQLQPYDARENPKGLSFESMPGDVPVDIIWGVEDQMMPPAQMWRSVYAFPGPVQSHPIAGANHFSEIDKPYDVADAMTSSLLRQDKNAIPVFLGGNPDLVFKGDEKEATRAIAEEFPGAPRI